MKQDHSQIRGQDQAQGPAEDMFASTCIPVSVVLECKQVQRGRWSAPSWRVSGVLAGERVAGDRDNVSTLIHKDDQREEHLFGGLELALYKDGAESYWHNLMGKNPSLYVVCRQEEDEAFCPMLVTANQYEAGSHVEAEDTVLDVAIPPEIYQWIERFVVENYIPEETKKRKRKKWDAIEPDERGRGGHGKR